MTTAVNPVLRVAPAAPAEAAAHFRAGLAFHTDVSDVAAALGAGGDPGFVLVDSRSTEAWDQGHIPGALHLPTALVPEQAGQLLDRSVPVVTYCWGPGCNGAAPGGPRPRRTRLPGQGDARRLRVLGARGPGLRDLAGA